MASKPHEQALDILSRINDILGEHPGSRIDHQRRLNSIKYLEERLVHLENLEDDIRKRAIVKTANEEQARVEAEKANAEEEGLETVEANID